MTLNCSASLQRYMVVGIKDRQLTEDINEEENPDVDTTSRMRKQISDEWRIEWS